MRLRKSVGATIASTAVICARAFVADRREAVGCLCGDFGYWLQAPAEARSGVGSHAAADGDAPDRERGASSDDRARAPAAGRSAGRCRPVSGVHSELAQIAVSGASLASYGALVEGSCC